VGAISFNKFFQCFISFIVIARFNGIFDTISVKLSQVNAYSFRIFIVHSLISFSLGSSLSVNLNLFGIICFSIIQFFVCSSKLFVELSRFEDIISFQLYHFLINLMTSSLPLFIQFSFSCMIKSFIGIKFSSFDNLLFNSSIFVSLAFLISAILFSIFKISLL
jgi:hypothetical protein